MSTRQTYPNDWAALIADLCAPPMNQSKFARTVGVGRNTPGRWIRGEVTEISMPSIRLIARFSGKTEDEVARIALGAQEQAAAADDEIVQMIRNDYPYAPDELKRRLIELVRSRRLENEESLRETVNLALNPYTAQPET
jgi:transcriptional regulator with XRE-family HTH domain